MNWEGGSCSEQQEKEILDILLESDLYLELPLKERRQLFKNIVKAYLYSDPDKSGHHYSGQEKMPEAVETGTKPESSQ